MTVPEERLAEEIRTKRLHPNEVQLTGISMDVENQIGKLWQTFAA